MGTWENGFRELIKYESDTVMVFEENGRFSITDDDDPPLLGTWTSGEGPEGRVLVHLDYDEDETVPVYFEFVDENNMLFSSPQFPDDGNAYRRATD